MASTYPDPRIQTPRGKSGVKQHYVMESNGHLHCIVMYLQYPSKNFVLVFEMLEENSNWFEKYRVDLDPISGDFAGENGLTVSILGIIRGNREEESALVIHVPGKIMVYGFHDKRFKVVVDFRGVEFYRSGELQFGRHDAYQFIETLAPV